jgi:hypothetical protein
MEFVELVAELCVGRNTESLAAVGEAYPEDAVMAICSLCDDPSAVRSRFVL